MKRYKEFIGEGLLAAMKPKSKEDIDNAIEKILKDNPKPVEILELIFNSGVDIKLIPRDNNLLNKLGEENYNKLPIIYDIVKRLNRTFLVDDFYIEPDFIVANYTMESDTTEDYTYSFTFHIDKMITVIETNVWIHGDMESVDELFYRGGVDENIMSEFKNIIKKTIGSQSDSEDTYNNIIKSLN